MKHFKRRKFLINAFQYKLLGFSALYLVGIVLALYCAGVLSLVGDLYNPDLSSRERGESAQILIHLHGTVLPYLLPLLVAIVLHSVLVSHRIAGPVYRLSKALKEVGDGDLTLQVRLRAKDYLKPEASRLNEMVEALNSKVRSVHEGHANLAEELAQLEQHLERGEVDDIGEQVTALRRRLDELSLALGVFKTRERSATIREEMLYQAPVEPDARESPPSEAA